MATRLNPKEPKGAKALLLAPGALDKIDKRILEGDPIPSQDQFDVHRTDKGVEFSLNQGVISRLAGLRFACIPQFDSSGDYSGTCEIGEGTVYKHGSSVKMHEVASGITYPFSVSVTSGQTVYFKFSWDHREEEIGPSEEEGVTDMETRWEISSMTIEAGGSIPDASINWEAETAETYMAIAELNTVDGRLEVDQFLNSDFQPPPPARRHQKYESLGAISSELDPEAQELFPVVGIEGTPNGDCIDLKRTSRKFTRATRAVFQGVDEEGEPKVVFTFNEVTWAETNEAEVTIASVLACSAPRLIPVGEDVTGGNIEDKGKNFEISINTGGGGPGGGNGDDGDSDPDNNNKVPKEAPKPAPPADPEDPPNKDYHTRCRDSDGGVKWEKTEKIPADKIRTDVPEFVGPSLPPTGEKAAKSRWVLEVPPIDDIGLPPPDTQTDWKLSDDNRVISQPGPPSTLTGELSPGIPGDWWYDETNEEWWRKWPSIDGWGDWQLSETPPPWIPEILIDDTRVTGPADSASPLNPLVDYAEGGSVSVDLSGAFDDIGHTLVAEGLGDNALIQTPEGLYAPPNPVPVPPPVDSVAGKIGAVNLDADDIDETRVRMWFTTEHLSRLDLNTAQRHEHPNKNFLDTLSDSGDGTRHLADDGTYKVTPVLTAQEKADIASNTSQRHAHANKSLLDAITGAGDGSMHWANDGTYKPTPRVDSVNGKATAAVVLNTDDIAEGATNKYITAAERADFHSHANKSVLDAITDDGDGTQAWMNDGAFKTLVETINGKTGPAAVITMGDISETATEKVLTAAERTKISYILDTGLGTKFLGDDGLYHNSTTDAPVDSVNGKTGIVALDMDDLTETASGKILTSTERTKIGLLDDTGDGSHFLDDSGVYRAPTFLAPVKEVNGKTGTVVLNTDDIAEGSTNRYATVDDTRVTGPVASANPLNPIVDYAEGGTVSVDLSGAFDDIGHTLVAEGLGDNALIQTPDGLYVPPNPVPAPPPVESVNGKIGAVDIDLGDIAETSTRKHFTTADKSKVDLIRTDGNGDKIYYDDGRWAHPLISRVAGRTGDISLSADDISEVTNKRWLTDAERAKLGFLTATGDGDGFLTNKGEYTRLPPAPVTSVANQTGNIALRASDVAETATMRWMTPGEKDKVTRLRDNGDGSNYLNDRLEYLPLPVTAVAGKSGGPVNLDANDIAEVVNKRWLTDAERTQIAEAAADRHSHANGAILDLLTDSGNGSKYWADDGTYRDLPTILVESVNGSTGHVTLDADDVAEGSTNRYVTAAEKTDIATNTSQRHTHTNAALLDSIIDSGSGGLAFTDDGSYRSFVSSVNGQIGAANLTTAHIAESANEKYVTPAEKADIASNTSQRHAHANKSLLDAITGAGDGSMHWANDGTYKPTPRVDSVNGKATAAVVLNTDDIAEGATNKYITAAERADIALNTANRHSHANQAVLDTLTATGDGSKAFMDNGLYAGIPVTSVAGLTGDIDLDASHIAETASLKWMTAAEEAKLGLITDQGDGSAFLGSDGIYDALNADDVAEVANKRWFTDAERTKVGFLTSSGAGNEVLYDNGGYAPLPVTSVAGKSGGAVTLNANDVTEILNKRWLTDAEREQIADAAADRHVHGNNAVLDVLTNTGNGNLFFADDGTYRSVPFDAAPVDSVAGKVGEVMLDASDIAEVVNRRWLTDAERTNIASSAADRHVHGNSVVLDVLTNTGAGDLFFADDGTYRSVPVNAAPVDSVAGRTGEVTLDASDIAEVTDRRWLTDAERTQITANTNDRHVHGNSTVLNALTDSGAGNLFFADDGAYRAMPPAPVDSVAGKIGAVLLDLDDVSETSGKKIFTSLERTKVGWLSNSGLGDKVLYDDGVYEALPVTSVAGKSGGAVTLDADDVDPVTNKNWLTDAERANIASSAADRHVHGNSAVLNALTDSGLGNLFFADDGTYRSVPFDAAPVDSVAGKVGEVTLNFDDIGETATKKWFTSNERNKVAILTTGGAGAEVLYDNGDYAPLPVTAVAGKSGGPITLDADDIAEVTNKLWMLDAERTKVGLIKNDGLGDRFLNDAGVYSLAPVTTVAGKAGNVALNADDISEVTNRRWMLDAERTKVALITTGGTGGKFFNDQGNYIHPPAAPVDSVAGQIGAVTLNADDVAETATKKWLTDTERANISEIPLWWPTTKPPDGTYTSFTVTGATVTFHS